jgi:hypothetical protein
MVTNNAAIGRHHPRFPDADSRAPLPPPARTPRLEMDRASAVPNHSYRRLRGIFSGATQAGDPEARKEKVMEATLTDLASTPPASELRKAAATPETRPTRAAAVFAALWLALAVGSPFIVRYGPSPDDHAMTALATRMEAPRCATASQFGFPCAGTTLTARAVHPVEEPDL